MTGIIYPHQLFEIKYLPYKDINNFVIIEDPLFFKDSERDINFNMLRLIYNRACMKYYYDYLKNYFDVKYIEYNINPSILYKMYHDKTLHIIDPIDKLLEERIDKYSNKYNIKIIKYDTPYFLYKNDELQEYRNLHSNFYQTSFYINTRKKFNILMKNNKPIGDKYSFDKYNRNVLPTKSFKEYIKENKIKITKQEYSNKYYDEAIKYCNKTFKNHYKNYEPNNIYYVPITHEDSKKHLKLFIKEKLEYFGKFQDYVDKDEVEMFHSFISPMLNNGLLTPKYVLDNILKNYEKDNLHSIEGFIRQLNWREYSRYLYRFNDNMKQNYFNNNNMLTKQWFDGTLNILPIDTLIKKAFLTGYLHHIERLMFMSNYMNLCRIHPDQVYYWFMAFSLDSYDWVMINNVYSMGLYADGGTSTTKPYFSSSNYILKMSNFPKGEWIIIWYVLYYYFIYKNYKKLKINNTFFRSQWNKLKDKDSIILQGRKLLK